MEIEIILNLRWNKWLRIHLNAHLHSVIIPSLHEQYVVLLIFISMQLIFIKFWLFWCGVCIWTHIVYVVSTHLFLSVIEKINFASIKYYKDYWLLSE